MEFILSVNGDSYTVDVEPDKPLLWVLREDVGLQGTKYGCGIGACGACTVLIDGAAVRSCVVAVETVGTKAITTIEGLTDELGKAIKDAWIDRQVPQCGYCQPGQIVAAYSLLAENPDPSEDAVNEKMTNLCRCGTYQRIRSAIKTASATVKKQVR